MEPLSDTELQAMAEAGSRLESSPAWDVAIRELERRKAAVVQSVLLGKAETYEDYLEKRAEYRALETMIQMPMTLKAAGASHE